MPYDLLAYRVISLKNLSGKTRCPAMQGSFAQPAPPQHCFVSYVPRVRFSMQETGENLISQCWFQSGMWRNVHFDFHLPFLIERAIPATNHLTCSTYTVCRRSWITDILVQRIHSYRITIRTSGSHIIFIPLFVIMICNGITPVLPFCCSSFFSTLCDASCRVGQRCTLNLSRAETSSRWCGS
ncbi:hypothetical protein TNCV_3498551 [Trichonephila clavipes]|nr:hypothetical protein TNCV_3498551 [Trichonephila clavipes]